jgi:preprotein translocase subunit Sec61beta
MKKCIVLIMALTFALGITSLAFAAEEKKPADVPASKGVVGAGLASPTDKQELEKVDPTKKATTKKGEASKGVGPAGLASPTDKQELGKLDPTKKATTKKKKATKGVAPAGLASPTDKQEIEKLQKPSTADKMKETPAEKK